MEYTVPKCELYFSNTHRNRSKQITNRCKQMIFLMCLSHFFLSIRILRYMCRVRLSSFSRFRSRYSTRTVARLLKWFWIDSKHRLQHQQKRFTVVHSGTVFFFLRFSHFVNVSIADNSVTDIPCVCFNFSKTAP